MKIRLPSSSEQDSEEFIKPTGTKTVFTVVFMSLVCISGGANVSLT
jgi:hypothetical protein